MAHFRTNLLQMTFCVISHYYIIMGIKYMVYKYALLYTQHSVSLIDVHSSIHILSFSPSLSPPHKSIFTMSDSPDDHESMSTTSNFFEIAHFLSGRDRASHVSWVVVVVTVATSVTRNWNKM